MQEGKKLITVSLNSEKIAALNAIYTRVMEICKIGKVAFKDDSVKLRQFSFEGVVNTLNNTKAPEAAPEQP